jgi:DNA-directed RNA polymerase specialized sigma subunit
VKARSDELTAEEWRLIEEALPEAYALARSLARRCPNHTEGELGALAEDSLRRRVRRFDATRGKKLFAFARQGVRLDLLRAAFTRAHDPCMAAGLRAMDRHEESIEHPELAARFAETLEEKDARARALGGRQMDAGHYAHTAARAARTPEDELGEREEWHEIQRAAEATAPGAAALLDLLYKEDLSWKEAATRLGVDMRQAQRIEEKVLARLRALISGRRRRA